MLESKASGWLSQLQGQVSRRVPKDTVPRRQEDYCEAVPVTRGFQGLLTIQDNLSTRAEEAESAKGRGANNMGRQSVWGKPG